MHDATVRDILALIAMAMAVVIIIAIAWSMYGWLWLCRRGKDKRDKTSD